MGDLAPNNLLGVFRFSADLLMKHLDEYTRDFSFTFESGVNRITLMTYQDRSFVIYNREHAWAIRLSFFMDSYEILSQVGSIDECYAELVMLRMHHRLIESGVAERPCPLVPSYSYPR